MVRKLIACVNLLHYKKTMASSHQRMLKSPLYQITSRNRFSMKIVNATVASKTRLNYRIGPKKQGRSSKNTASWVTSQVQAWRAICCPMARFHHRSKLPARAPSWLGRTTMIYTQRCLGNISTLSYLRSKKLSDSWIQAREDKRIRFIRNHLVSSNKVYPFIFRCRKGVRWRLFIRMSTWKRFLRNTIQLFLRQETQALPKTLTKVLIRILRCKRVLQDIGHLLALLQSSPIMSRCNSLGHKLVDPEHLSWRHWAISMINIVDATIWVSWWAQQLPCLIAEILSPS